MKFYLDMMSFKLSHHLLSDEAVRGCVPIRGKMCPQVSVRLLVENMLFYKINLDSKCLQIALYELGMIKNDLVDVLSQVALTSVVTLTFNPRSCTIR